MFVNLISGLIEKDMYVLLCYIHIYIYIYIYISERRSGAFSVYKMYVYVYIQRRAESLSKIRTVHDEGMNIHEQHRHR